MNALKSCLTATMHSVGQCWTATGNSLSGCLSGSKDICSNFGTNASSTISSIFNSVIAGCSSFGSSMSRCCSSTGHAISGCFSNSVIPCLARVKDAVLGFFIWMKNWITATPDKPQNLLFGCVAGAAATLLALFCVQNCCKQTNSAEEPDPESIANTPSDSPSRTGSPEDTPHLHHSHHTV